ncbi:MAG: peptidoglycan DD-metalloendopeptidase family protein [Bacteroidetes bacterium]|nr:peptidoglycan DD-metalloendopeptidase family protein [Bacteroidota bacterium]MCH8524119.1 peptidoglycan DD-metalloendopeptidase family protein [Balneolales bacterium]
MVEPSFQQVEYVAEPNLDVFGIPSDEFETVRRPIRRNENLATIFTGVNIPADRVHRLMQSSRDVFDVRRIMAGRPLYLYYASDNTESPEFIVYEQNLSEFIVFDVVNEAVFTGNKEVTRKMRTIEGVIESSLYNTLIAQGASAQMANALSEVFAWQIDFYRIQRGDAFRVKYEENVIDGTPTSIHRIHAAYFRHFGRDYYAIYFKGENEEFGNYYDLQGESMRKAFLRAPLEYTRISSRFTNRRFHPVLRRNMPHHGTDYAAPVGTPIRATGDGVVIRASFDNNNGNYVRIRHNSTYESGYLHMSRIATGVRPGATVKQGQVIGYVGQTGLATGPHLCYRFWVNGRPADPHRIEFPSANPIEVENRAAFNIHRTQMFAYLSRPNTADRPGAWSIIAVDDITAHIPERPLILSNR